MRVLLLQPPIEDFYTTPIRLYPLGLLYAAKVLEEAGAEVGVLDCLTPLEKRKIPLPVSFKDLPPLAEVPFFFRSYYRFGLSDEEILARIREFSPEFIGISSQFTAYYKNVEDLARLIKREIGLPVFIGGNHATVLAAEIRRRTPEIDFVLEGPAEECLPTFLEKIGWERSGLRRDKRRAETKDRVLRPARPDWRRILPAHHLLRGEDYRIGRKRMISLSASRGCPYDCLFCSVHRMFGRTIRYRTIDSVLSEMRLNYGQKGTRLFNFEDDNLSYDRRWFLDFLAAVEAEPELEGIELTAMNGLCADTLDEDVLAAMRRAGFRRINLSLVTRSGELRKRYRRPYYSDKIDKFYDLIRAAQHLDLFVTVYVILGLPGQSRAEVKESIDELLAMGVLVGPSVFYLDPGSRLYEEIEVPAAVANDWNLYRSSAFAVETPGLSRAELLDLFSYVRRKNLERKNRVPFLS